ncbi:MAG: TIGR04282 family arsenosugar biosynthesis glycosyltransferase [Chloroflexi bacterium]|nr:TIGR04282 family arsenosugar biosynthesis glycosyltransferase [Chloroflexota bacterium]
MRQSIFVVAKRPATGHTKTRLCPPLTGAQAAALYECFLRDTLDTMRQVPGVRRSIAYLADDGSQEEEARRYFHALASDMALTPQRGHDLGERLHHLLSDALNSGVQQAVVVDSDSPTLPPSFLAQAFAVLDGPFDVVLGPCDDGGYYLIGLKQPQPRLLCEVKMSTATVLTDTLALAAEMQLRVGLLPVWYDVDTVAELHRLHAELTTTGALVAQHTRAFLPSIGLTEDIRHASIAHYSSAE